MSAHLLYSMTCDGDDCMAAFTIGSRFATPMRAEALKIGWTSGLDPRAKRNGPVKTIDLCPECSARKAAEPTSSGS